MKKNEFRMLPSRLPGIHALEASSRHSFARHTHEQFGIGLVLQGAQKSRSGRGMVEAMAGDTITVNPGEVHDGTPLGDSGRTWRMLYFDPALVIAAGRELSDGRSAEYEFRHPVVRAPRLALRFRRLFAAASDDAADMLCEQLLLGLLADLLQECIPECRSPASEAVRRARCLIDDDPAPPITLAALAQESGLSRFQLVRHFSRATGLTPHAYLVQRRVAVARRLIASGTGLAAAAAASGFADQSHMTRIFISKYGISPHAYARASAGLAR